MEILVVEAKHESGQVLRLTRTVDPEEGRSPFAVLRDEYVGEAGRYRELARWNRLDKALEHFSDVLRNTCGIGRPK